SDRGTPPCSLIANTDRTRCWRYPIRPVTPFITTPRVVVVISVPSPAAFDGRVPCSDGPLESAFHQTVKVDGYPRQPLGTPRQAACPVGPAARGAPAGRRAPRWGSGALRPPSALASALWGTPVARPFCVHGGIR